MIPFRSLLQLCRIPNVFTAFADIFAGYLIFHRFSVADAKLGGLLVASGCLYTAGMIFNDVCDRKQDAVERPHRPIPSGRISTRFAAIFAAVLLLIGCLAACTVSSRSAAVAAAIAVAVVLYDALLKRTFLGPPLMGACRGLNLLLGMSAAAVSFSPWPHIVLDTQLLLPVALGTYVTGLTWFGRREAAQSTRPQLIAALTVQNAALLVALVALLPVAATDTDAPLFALVVALAFILLTGTRAGSAAIRSLHPNDVQHAVKTGILNIVVFDAAIVFAAHGILPGLAVLALLVPTIYLARRIPQT